MVDVLDGIQVGEVITANSGGQGELGEGNWGTTGGRGQPGQVGETVEGQGDRWGQVRG